MDKTRYPFNGAAPKPASGPAPTLKAIHRQFPTMGSNEPLTAMLMSRDDREAIDSYQATTAWLSDLMEDPDLQESDHKNLGLLGKDEPTRLRRRYRKVAGKRALRLPAKEDVPQRPEMLPGTPRKREWVLVPRDSMPHLQELEDMLRKEKSLLANQAAIAFNRSSLTTHQPLPMTKLAVEDACDRQMRAARDAVETLLEELQRRRRKRMMSAVSTVGGGSRQ